MAQKIKELFKKEFEVNNGDFYWILLKTLIVSALIFIGLFLPIFNFFAFLLALVFITFEYNLKKLYYLVFLLPFNHVFSLSVDSFSFNSLLLLYTVFLIGLNYLIDLIKKRKTIDIPLFIISVLIIIYAFLPLSGKINFVGSLSISATVVACYLTYCYRDEINLKEIFIGLFVLTMLASLIALFDSFIPRLSSYLQVFRINNIKRFMGLLQDPNYYALELITLLGLASILLYHNKINLLFYVFILPLTMFGIMTCSKTFILVYIIWFICTIVMIVIKHRKNLKKLSLSLFAFILIIAIGFLACFNYSKELLTRFSDTSFVMDNAYDVEDGDTADKDSGSDIESAMTNFTTGRSDIWITYIEVMLDNPVKLLFGYGVGADYLKINYGAPTAAHNTIIQTLYCFGLCGSLLILSALGYVLIKLLKSKQIKFNVFNFVPMVITCIMMCALDCLIGYRIFITIIACAYAIGLSADAKEDDKVVGSDKKRLLLVHRNLTFGGIEKSLVNFISEMKDDYEIELALMQKSGDFINQLPDSVKTFEMSQKMNFYGFESAKKRNFVVGLYYFVLKVVRKLFSFCPIIVKMIVSGQEKIGKYDFAISFSQDPFCMEYVASKVEASKKAVIYHIDPKALHSFEINKSVLNKYDHIFNVSESCMINMKNKFPFVEAKLDYLYNFQNIEEIKNKSIEFKVDKSKKFRFITVARICREKGIFRVVEAIKKLKDDGFEFEWQLVGSGQLLDEVKNKVKEYGLENYVEFVGYKSNPYPYMISSDMFVLPSFHEACPMVFFESLLLELPVLTTETCSAKEIIGDCGLICENTDEAIYLSMKHVLENKETLKEYKNKIKLREFSNKEIKEKLLSLVERDDE